jgi:hypothetical protein
VPATFKITTTISFNVAVGTSASLEAAPNAKPNEDGRGLSDGKASVSGGVSASYAKSASFTHTLEATAAKKYLDDIAANGRGGSFPEHQILATGMSDGWEAAARLYQTMTGSAAQAKAMKPGDEIETSSQTGVGAKLGGSGGETREGGGTVAVDLSASKTHKVTLNRKPLPDDTIQVTASIDDATDVAGGVGVNVGMAGGKAGVSHGTGQGHSVAFVLDPKSPDFDKVFKEIEGASSAAELDRIAARQRTGRRRATARTRGSRSDWSARTSAARVSSTTRRRATATATRSAPRPAAPIRAAARSMSAMSASATA